ncbi:MAG: NAD(P)H-dependent oxidoreductase subunit E [Candidatus Omnitrophica bacterium CG11_big_fil_rev_8_21_14_0_20_42_13]|uniref:NAD(P)H-dependent oxidoreductase subunit E n=1 Tax=Candidatus Ghiorseimicrobium undicola TaxID=1974746 RepID=A0A2H0LYH1_9BACT|nr:MAG: NAD(P)H-dependent oxidoreductase subunit E [Candidatus Omnitrophica bacterium CG11_big_fil_rev_8_21_14_0_20_42_13]
MRLACQVKVRNDIEIYIPDYLTTVKNIVANRSYDKSLRWVFKIDRQPKEAEYERGPAKIEAREKSRIDEIINAYKNVKSSLILMLQEINTSYTYFPEHVLWYLSGELGLPYSHVFRVATFYNAFSLKPRGKNMIRVCLGTSCYVKGGNRILHSLENKLGIKVGETTRDLMFSLETVNCIGCCGQSPAISVNDEIYGYVRIGMMDDILRKYK